MGVEQTQLANEGAVLGSMLLNRDKVAEVRQILLSEHCFTTPAHRLLYNELVELDKQLSLNVKWDLVVVANHLTQTYGLLDAVGGIGYLIRLVDSLPTAENAVYYCEKLNENYRTRLVAATGAAMQKNARNPQRADELIHYARQQLDAIDASTREQLPDGKQALLRHIENARNGLVQQHSGFDLLDKLTGWLRPGSVSLIAGGPGNGKSFFALEILSANETAWLLALEDDKPHHMARILAQRTGIPKLTDPQWVSENEAAAHRAVEEHGEWLLSTGRRLCTLEKKTTVSYADLLDWVRQAARDGARTVIIDPVTAARQDCSKIWVEDKDFILRLKRLADQTKIAAVCVMHPTKTLLGMPDLSSLAGGAAYGRFAHTIVWIETHNPPKSSRVRTLCGQTDLEHNRTIHILKSRFGPGQGVRLAATFGENLKYRLYGLVLKKKNKKSQPNDDDEQI